VNHVFKPFGQFVQISVYRPIEIRTVKFQLREWIDGLNRLPQCSYCNLRFHFFDGTQMGGKPKMGGHGPPEGACPPGPPLAPPLLLRSQTHLRARGTDYVVF